PNEVLMVFYAIFFVWLLSLPTWMLAARNLAGTSPPDWFFKLNPFVLVYAPYEYPGYLTTTDVAIFLGATLGISAALVVAAVRTLRRELRPAGRRSERLERWRNSVHARLFSWWPSPSLDGNPVLWREWHRSRPSRA